jgi:carbamoyltransferase
MVHLAKRLYARINAGRKKPVTDLCLAGGVALNCVANYEIAARTPFKRIWVQPMANDAGTALGAAALVHFQQGGKTRPRMAHAFWGPGYSPDEMQASLNARGLAFSKPDNVAAEVATRIERAQIVAWFQGRQEVGPRALGHRSIVTDPSRFDARNRLKSDEVPRIIRPFAPSVLPGAGEFFELPAGYLDPYAFACLARAPRGSDDSGGRSGEQFPGRRCARRGPADPLYAS